MYVQVVYCVHSIPTVAGSKPFRPRRAGCTVTVTQPDLLGALSVIRPLSRSATGEMALELQVGNVNLDDVGDMAETKQALTVRYDADIVAAFKATGKGWQTRMNEALRDWLKTHSPA